MLKAASTPDFSAIGVPLLTGSRCSGRSLVEGGTGAPNVSSRVQIFAALHESAVAGDGLQEPLIKDPRVGLNQSRAKGILLLWL